MKKIALLILLAAASTLFAAERQRQRWLRHGSFPDRRDAHAQGHSRRHLWRSGDRRNCYLGRVDFC